MGAVLPPGSSARFNFARSVYSNDVPSHGSFEHGEGLRIHEGFVRRVERVEVMRKNALDPQAVHADADRVADPQVRDLEQHAPAL